MGQATKDTSSNGTAPGFSTQSQPEHTQVDGVLHSPLVTQARGVASHLTTQAKDLVTKRVATTQERSSLELTGIAEALRQKGEELHDSMLGPMVGRAADQVDRASAYLKDASLTDVVRSTERFARREPLLFIGGAFTLGLLCARFLKSSSHHAQDEGASAGSMETGATGSR